MSEQEKRAAIGKYFAPFPKWTLWAMGIGLLAALTGGGGGIAVGLILGGIGSVFAGLHYRDRISDADYDRYRDEDLDRVVSARAVPKWGIDRAELVGKLVPVFGPAPGTTSTTGFKLGQDGILRYNPIRFAVFGFAEHQLFAYTGVLDMVTGNVVREETEEFFYRDVVAVSTKTGMAEFTWKGQTHQFNDTETFELTTSGATSIRVPLRSPKLASIAGGGELPTTQAEQAIASVRAMVRQKKSLVPA